MATAAGDIKAVSGTKKSLCLMAAQASATTAPTLATDGYPSYPIHTNMSADTGAFFQNHPPARSVLTIHNSAGSGSLTGVFTLYGYLAAAGKWFPVQVNGGSAVTGTTTVRYSELFTGKLAAFDRLFLDVQSPGGTSQQFEGWLTSMLEDF